MSNWAKKRKHRALALADAYTRAVFTLSDADQALLENAWPCSLTPTQIAQIEDVCKTLVIRRRIEISVGNISQGVVSAGRKRRADIAKAASRLSLLLQADLDDTSAYPFLDLEDMDSLCASLKRLQEIAEKPDCFTGIKDQRLGRPPSSDSWQVFLLMMISLFNKAGGAVSANWSERKGAKPGYDSAFIRCLEIINAALPEDVRRQASSIFGSRTQAIVKPRKPKPKSGVGRGKRNRIPKGPRRPAGK